MDNKSNKASIFFKLIVSILLIISIFYMKNMLNKTSGFFSQGFSNYVAPKAKKVPYTYSVHGKNMVDNYHWMRDEKWPIVENKEIITYLNEENEYAKKVFDDPNHKLKNEIFEELKGRIKLEDRSTYTKHNEYYYYSRTESDKDYPIFCRKYMDINASEQIILDANQLAKGKAYFKMGSFDVSNDDKLVVYTVDVKGNERYDIKIFDIDKNIELTENTPPPSILGGVVWDSYSTGFFYTPVDENWRTNKVFYHEVGGDSKNDLLIFENDDIKYNVSVSETSDKEFLIVNVSGHANNEVYFAKLKNEKLSQSSILLNLKKSINDNLLKSKSGNIVYDVDHNGGYFYIHINDISNNFRLAKVSVNECKTYVKWQNFIKDDTDQYLSSFDITKNFIILNYKKLGIPLIKVMNLKDETNHNIKFPDPVYTASGYSTNFEEDDIRFNYSSLKRPNLTYSYDYLSNKMNIIKEQEIPSGFDPNDYVVERIWAKSDSVKVPISLIYKKSLFNQDRPLYLTGYGSYGYSMPVNFRSTIFSLVDRGFTFALAHIRGGSDLGYSWYESSKLLNKKNTFKDFISCSEHLISNNYVKAGNIIISGGSAGGLLVGNVINERPEIYRAAIAHVPFVDFINTMLDETLPLTPGEYNEWGNPTASKEYFEYMLSYSPYDNIKQQVYPHLFVTAGISDPRVGYWEPAKWVSKLREVNLSLKNKAQKDGTKDINGSSVIIFKTNMDAGHAGASGRFDYLKEIAEEYVFAINIFDMQNK